MLHARDGRGAATALTAAATARFGDLDALPATLAAHPARTTAAFAPDVLRAAESGDPVAGQVRADAAAALAATTRAALQVTGPAPVAAVGGLAVALREPWLAALPAGTRVVVAMGGGLDGAMLLATRTDLPHEARVRRHPEGTAATERARSSSSAAT